MSDPQTLATACEMIAALRADLRQARAEAKSWRRFLAVEKWAANAANHDQLGKLLMAWEQAYDADTEQRCAGEDA